MAFPASPTTRHLALTSPDLGPLVKILERCWQTIPCGSLSFPEHGKSGTTVVLLPQHVAKAQNSKWDDRVFERELVALTVLKTALEATGIPALELFGVDVPLIIPPSTDPGVNMLVMTRLSGSNLWVLPEAVHEDWVIRKLATFSIKLDQVSASVIPTAKIRNPTVNETARCLLPDFAEELAPYLAYALAEWKKPSPTKIRFIHNDLNPGNILCVPELEKLGVIDFGQVYHGDPHFGLSRFIFMRMMGYGEKGVESGLKMIEEINRLSHPEPWAQMQRCIALIPLQIANAVPKRWDSPHACWQALTQEERQFLDQAIMRTRILFDQFGIEAETKENLDIESPCRIGSGKPLSGRPAPP